MSTWKKIDGYWTTFFFSVARDKPSTTPIQFYQADGELRNHTKKLRCFYFPLLTSEFLSVRKDFHKKMCKLLGQAGTKSMSLHWLGHVSWAKKNILTLSHYHWYIYNLCCRKDAHAFSQQRWYFASFIETSQKHPEVNFNQTLTGPQLFQKKKVILVLKVTMLTGDL